MLKVDSQSTTGSTPDELTRGMKRVVEREPWVFTVSDRREWMQDWWSVDTLGLPCQNANSNLRNLTFMNIQILSTYTNNVCLSEIVPVRNLVLDTDIAEGNE